MFQESQAFVQKAGLKLVSVEIKDFPLTETKIFRETRNAKLHGRLKTEQTRAWSNSMFLFKIECNS